jgi:dolichol-phosphate mannosyltransferase
MPLKLSLVIPTYNESANLEKLCRKIVNSLDGGNFDFEIIIVDDNSPDGTWRIAEGLAKGDLRIRLVRRISTKGLASAVIDGWKVSRGQILGVIDADMQHPAEILTEMLNQVSHHQEIDIVVASRYVAGGGFQNKSFWQAFKSGLAIFLGVRLLPKIFKSVKDPLSGYFILRKEVITAKQLRPMGYKILLEVLVMGNYKKVYEHPYLFAQRQAGKTKAGWKQHFIYLLQLFKLKNYRLGHF